MTERPKPVPAYLYLDLVREEAERVIADVKAVLTDRRRVDNADCTVRRSGGGWADWDTQIEEDPRFMADLLDHSRALVSAIEVLRSRSDLPGT